MGERRGVEGTRPDNVPCRDHGVRPLTHVQDPVFDMAGLPGSRGIVWGGETWGDGGKASP